MLVLLKLVGLALVVVFAACLSVYYFAHVKGYIQTDPKFKTPQLTALLVITCMGGALILSFLGVLAVVLITSL